VGQQSLHVIALLDNGRKIGRAQFFLFYAKTPVCSYRFSMSSASAAGASAPSQSYKRSQRSRSRSRSVSRRVRARVEGVRRAYRASRSGPEFMPTPWPSSYKCVLRFQQSTPVSGATPQTLRFRANDCYDPYYETGGAQPRGFDQLCSSNGPYQRFLVHKTVFQFTFWNSTTNVPVQWMVMGTNSTTAVGAWNTAQEQTQVQSREYICGALNVGENPITASKFTVTPRKLIGVPKAEYGVVDYGGTYTASPNQNAICQVIMNCMDNTTAVTGNLKVVMEIYVEFSDLELIPAS